MSWMISSEESKVKRYSKEFEEFWSKKGEGWKGDEFVSQFKHKYKAIHQPTVRIDPTLNIKGMLEKIAWN